MGDLMSWQCKLMTGYVAMNLVFIARQRRGRRFRKISVSNMDLRTCRTSTSSVDGLMFSSSLKRQVGDELMDSRIWHLCKSVYLYQKYLAHSLESSSRTMNFNWFASFQNWKTAGTECDWLKKLDFNLHHSTRTACFVISNYLFQSTFLLRWIYVPCHQSATVSFSMRRIWIQLACSRGQIFNVLRFTWTKIWKWWFSG